MNEEDVALQPPVDLVCGTDSVRQAKPRRISLSWRTTPATGLLQVSVRVVFGEPVQVLLRLPTPPSLHCSDGEQKNPECDERPGACRSHCCSPTSSAAADRRTLTLTDRAPSHRWPPIPHGDSQTGWTCPFSGSGRDRSHWSGLHARDASVPKTVSDRSPFVPGRSDSAGCTRRSTRFHGASRFIQAVPTLPRSALTCLTCSASNPVA